MERRRRYLPWLVCAVVAMVAVPGLATGQQADVPNTASVVVTDYAFQAAAVTITSGGTVNFSYPTGTRRHNIVFFTVQPSSCTQTAGDLWQPSPPLPLLALIAWSHTADRQPPEAVHRSPRSSRCS